MDRFIRFSAADAHLGLARQKRCEIHPLQDDPHRKQGSASFKA
jgi:hypothetical protein